MSQPSPTFNPRAVVLGYLTDMTTTKLFEIAVLLVLLDPGSASVRPLDRVDPNLLEWLGLSWGLFFTAVGGFVAARLAPRLRYSHAGMAGILSLVTCLATYGFNPGDASLALYHCGLLLTVPAALVGARVSRFWRD